MDYKNKKNNHTDRFKECGIAKSNNFSTYLIYGTKFSRLLKILFTGLTLGGLYLTSLYSYLLFHTISEFFSVTISISIFILVWNVRRQIDNYYLLFIGLSLIFIALLDLIHLMAYKGMFIFTGYDSNLPTCLWIAARYLQSLTLLIALWFCRRKVPLQLTMLTYSLLTIVIIVSIFLNIFPVCYLEGTGLTDFKKGSEYIIIVFLIIASSGLWRMRKMFEQRLVYLLISANLLSIGAELSFTTYLNVYGPSNLLGHMLKVAAFFLWYLAIVQAGITNPGEILYRRLSHNEKKFKTLSDQLEAILDHIPGLIFYKDKENNFIRVNRYFAKSVNKTKEELEGTSLYEIYSREDADKYFQDDFSVISSRSAKLNIIEQKWTADGMKWFDTAKIPFVNDDGEIIGVIVISMDITGRKQAEDKIKLLLAEKELILKEVHHRIKNNMNTIKSLLIIQADSLQDSAAVSALHDAEGRVESMMLLYDKLYRSDNYNNIAVQDYIPPLIDEIVSGFPNCHLVKIEKNIDDFVLDIKKLQPLGIIINELLTNMMKYAFTGISDGLISISLKIEGSTVSLVIADNGRGMPVSIDFENSTGFGIQLVGMLTEQIGGKIRIEHGNGTKFILEFYK